MPLIVWIGSLAAGIAVLGATGSEALAPPPAWPPAQWRVWAQERDGIDAAFAVLRLGTLTAASYLLLATLVCAVPRLRPLDVLVTGPTLRHLLGSLGVLTVSVVPSAAVAGAAEDPPVAVMRRLPEPEPPPPVVHDQPPPDARAHAPPLDIWVVRSGDHFWSIADRVVEAAVGRPPSDAEVDRYWRALITANRDRLAVPDEPDLVYPGQELRLPAP